MLIRNPEEEKREKEKYKKPFKVSLFYPFAKTEIQMSQIIKKQGQKLFIRTEVKVVIRSKGLLTNQNISTA